MPDDQANLLSQRIEREVRQMIGDLNMQILVLRNMLELSQPQQQPPQQQPKPPPQPIPPQPEPERKPEKQARSNGSDPYVRG